MSKKKSTKSSKPKSKSTSTRIKRPNINQVRAQIRELAKQHDYDEQVLLSFAEFVNGGKFKEVEPSMNEMKDAVIASFNCSSYQELKNETSFALFVQDQKLIMNSKASWLKAYRKFVGLPDSERNSIGTTSINGVDVLRNFLPWKVFNLDPEKATAADIKTAFNTLAMQHHPDKGGDSAVFEELKAMRDTLLAAF